MKTLLTSLIAVGSFSVIYGQEPILPSHFNETIEASDSITMSTAEIDKFTQDPDYFKIKTYNPVPVYHNVQDSIQRIRSIETLHPDKNNVASAKKYKF